MRNSLNRSLFGVIAFYNGPRRLLRRSKTARIVPRGFSFFLRVVKTARTQFPEILNWEGPKQTVVMVYIGKYIQNARNAESTTMGRKSSVTLNQVVVQVTSSPLAHRLLLGPLVPRLWYKVAATNQYIKCTNVYCYYNLGPDFLPLLLTRSLIIFFNLRSRQYPHLKEEKIYY